MGYAGDQLLTNFSISEPPGGLAKVQTAVSMPWEVWGGTDAAGPASTLEEPLLQEKGLSCLPLHLIPCLNHSFFLSSAAQAFFPVQICWQSLFAHSYTSAHCRLNF